LTTEIITIWQYALNKCASLLIGQRLSLKLPAAMHTDLQLLAHYHQKGDISAFQQLVKAHAGMVYATARRVTQDAVLAEDIAQETFLQLARQGKQIRDSVAAWLHRVAWTKACSSVRSEATRRKYEAAVAESANTQQQEAPWANIEPELDAAIASLPEELRGPLIQHFLEGVSQRDIAEHLGVNQSTVSRGIEAGVTALRRYLRSKGILCGSGIGTLLSANALQAAPSSIYASLNKLALSGIGAGGSGTLVSIAKGFSISALVLVCSIAFIKRPEGASKANPGSPSASIALPETSDGLTVEQSRSPPESTPSRSPVPEIVYPVHELLHSFAKPPESPNGPMVRDRSGWIWGTVSSGGSYGYGFIYKMRPTGEEVREVVAFRGDHGSPRGAGPCRRLLLREDGTIWGTTVGNYGDQKFTLFKLDPVSEQVTTVCDIPDAVTFSWCDEKRGLLWGNGSAGLVTVKDDGTGFRIVKNFSGASARKYGSQLEGFLTYDEAGSLWGTASFSGHFGKGTIFKVNVHTSEVITVAHLSGTAGAAPGATPRASLTQDRSGFLWGTTSYGGEHNGGTIFKLRIADGSFQTVWHFKPGSPEGVGVTPDSSLTWDDNGNLWGATSAMVLSKQGNGALYKVNASTGKVSLVVKFTGRDGAVPGGPAREDLILDGIGGLIAPSSGGGQSYFGTIYRVDIQSEKFQHLADMLDWSENTEGSEPWSSLVADSHGWLWGSNSKAGLHDCGTVFKVHPVTGEFKVMAEFTGVDGPVKGRRPFGALVADGAGYLWGTTTMGGKRDLGTLFKISEATGVLQTILESSPEIPKPGSFSPLVADGTGHIWGKPSGGPMLYRIHVASDQVLPVKAAPLKRVGLTSDTGSMTMDHNGKLWYCLAPSKDRSLTEVCRIDVKSMQSEVFYTIDHGIAIRGNTRGGTVLDRNGRIWFSSVAKSDSGSWESSLYRLAPETGAAQQLMYRVPSGQPLPPPFIDEMGVAWGAIGHHPGGLYRAAPPDYKASKFLTFTFNGSQYATGSQPQVGPLIKHSDGNLYGVTRYGGPGGGGTLYRLRFGPTPVTQAATVQIDGTVELHGTIKPNGRTSEASFEWGEDVELQRAKVIKAGIVSAKVTNKAVSAVLKDVKPNTTYYFRVIGINPANEKPQHGAILHFTTAAVEAIPSDVLAAADDLNRGSITPPLGAALDTKRYALLINRVPGAGAGIVRGALAGEAYEIGKRYTLTAVNDNGYSFERWSGPGIDGIRAENARLDFLFTKELADNPIITATFVLSPFTRVSTGKFHGLAMPAEDISITETNTAGIQLVVSDSGVFSGRLRHDGNTLPIRGKFDHGGLGRFGTARRSWLKLDRKGKPPVTLSLQLGLGGEALGQVFGSLGTVEKGAIHELALVHVIRDLETSLTSHQSARIALKMEASESKARDAHLRIASDGAAVLTVSLDNGAKVLARSPLNVLSEHSFFQQPYINNTRGSFGGPISVKFLATDSGDQPQALWWCKPGETATLLSVRQE
jgi:RNA polymerase sigma factor (sigma-70 family)